MKLGEQEKQTHEKLKNGSDTNGWWKYSV
jgi:hypothetical protein